jgi:hypothetical protein
LEGWEGRKEGLEWGKHAIRAGGVGKRGNKEIIG